MTCSPPAPLATAQATPADRSWSAAKGPYSNADLLACAELSTDPLTQELAARYAAALGFLHRDDVRLTVKTN